ncbi:SMP-30/gluconolactonase/LRE family protein [Emticicia sp. BO119]|uniref:SMP-30/gluconolactonase/LRE family protein n=1 Tax=Emticicia sp. BO119 TaxID=2757768 RepID=UPI0015F0629C|nr:SMP-30/gluconolactonase/LRE family protein [Emticicia sp. BO119]MBA4852270.1 SMP-30/gluconolactonase/LRE family protein [Emticicia sp. BO119]
MKKLLFIIICLLTCFIAYTHPGIGIVTNTKGEIFYSDLSRVWKVSADGKTKTIVVPKVHTHELYMDKQDNLYGEHLWYEGEAIDKWGHFVWKYDSEGKFIKVKPDTEGFLSNYSFTRDAQGNMYWIERGKKESILMKRDVAGKVSILQTLKTTDVRWQYCQEDGTFFYVDDNDLFKIKDGKVSTVSLNLDEVRARKIRFTPNHSIFGMWTDNAENVYVAVYENREIRKIQTNGKVSVAYTAPVGWHPTGGLFDKDGNLWVLENNSANQVRVVKVNRGDLAKVASEKSDINFMIFNLFCLLVGGSLLFFLIRKFPIMKSFRLMLQTTFLICFVSFNSLAQNSGLAVGEDAPAFDPYHVSGKDKGTKTCPMCKYGAKTDGLMVWINDDLQNYEKLLSFLEGQYLTKNANNWKTFIVFMNPNHKKESLLKRQLSDYTRKLDLKNVAFTFINSPTDTETAGVYEINPKVKNTIFAYKKRVITKKFVNFDTGNENFSALVNF